MMAFWSSLYFIWAHLLRLPYPIPWEGAFNAGAGVATIVAVIWFRFPKSWRKSSTFRNRAKYLISAQLFILVLSFEYWVFSWVFVEIPLDFQWIMALILPFSREIGAMALTKISTRIAGREDETGELLANYLAITYHMVFLSVAVGSLATNITIYILLGIDHFINFYHVISTFRTK